MASVVGRQTWKGAMVLILALALAGIALEARVSAAAESTCEPSSIGLTPITDMDDALYRGHSGGLYPDGRNVVPADHLELGLRLANQVRPRTGGGNPSERGLIGVLSIGVSNTRTEFMEFVRLASRDSTIDDRVIFINGAQGGRPLEDWAVGPDSATWTGVEAELRQAGVSPAQVQVAWMKLPNATRGTPSLDAVSGELDELARVLQIAKRRFPNLQIVYLSSRVYGGYGGQRAEPAAYHHGFTIKWLIERQIDGDPTLNADVTAGEVVSPWIAWGPYMWADGEMPRSDGLTWSCDDFVDDGIHPGRGASSKVASMLLDHFLSHPTSVEWFQARESRTVGPREPVPESSPGVATPPSPPDAQPPRRAGDTSAAERVETETHSSRVPARSDEAPSWLVMMGAVSIGFSIGMAGAIWLRSKNARVGLR
jgi:hypothetical protein